MTPRFFDAHNHLHDARLDAQREAIERDLARLHYAGSVVNGTCENDWPAVEHLARRREDVLPSYGLHPWNVRNRSENWLERLNGFLDRAGARVAVGEIGLDAWIPDHDIEDQRGVFLAQLKVAAERNLAATIHCLHAWGPLADALRGADVPERGFLIHAYGGPLEMVLPFARRGAYFSFNPSYLAEKKRARREVFRQIPLERLLVETDAPDMPPPPEYNRHPLPAEPDGRVVNHPANIEVAYASLAQIRDTPLEELAAQVEHNFRLLFGNWRES